MRRIGLLVIAAACVLPPVFGCKADPRVRPVKMGPVDTGPSSIEAVRRQLKGTWELTALELFSPTGEKIPAQATGRLQYDEYGNIAMQGTIAPGGPQIDGSVLNLTGRVAIDPVTGTLRITKVEAASADDKRVDPQLDTANVRYYELTGDVLKTTVKNASGATTATATWKRIE